MSCITKILEMKGDSDLLPLDSETFIEGGGTYRHYEYIITFVYDHRCGYVAIPSNHLLYKKDVDEQHWIMDDRRINCHGSITFRSREHEIKNFFGIGCNDLWIGFDAMHCDDLPDVETMKKYGIPLHVETMKKYGIPLHFFVTRDYYPNQTVKNYDYMENECKKIIDQLVVMTGDTLQ